MLKLFRRLNGLTLAATHSVGFRRGLLGIVAVAAVAAAIAGATAAARAIYTLREDLGPPIIAGTERDDMPALMRGNVLPDTTSRVRGEPRRRKPPRMCEMTAADLASAEADAFTTQSPGYTRRNEYVRPYRVRRGPLNDREMRLARAAWTYFEKFTQEETGLANAVGNYPSTTMWDTAAYIGGLVAAYELCLIEKPEFDRRMTRLLATLRGLDLFRRELPNKVYHTKTGAKVNYANKPGEIGFSALDLGRLLVWLRIVKNRYTYLGNSVDSILLRWDFRNVIDSEGVLYGASIHKETGATVYVQEGRLGYEEYAAKGFALWGFRPLLAHRPEPYLTAEIFGVAVPYDGRDPRIFHSQNYVVTESYLQDGLELGFDLPHDDSTPAWLHSDGWRAEFADRIYRVQEQRWRHTGFLTARSEHNVKGPPYFTYDTIFSNGYAWNTVTPRGDYVPEFAAVASKAAIGLWALVDSEYTDILFEAVADNFDPEMGVREGLFEAGQGPIEIFTANNNGVILTALLYKVQGPILTPYDGPTEVWYTSFRDRDLRVKRNYPDPPDRKTWLPAIRYPTDNKTGT